MIMRILHPDSGENVVLANKNSVRPARGWAYLPEERGLYKQMKVRDVLRFMPN